MKCIVLVLTLVSSLAWAKAKAAPLWSDSHVRGADPYSQLLPLNRPSYELPKINAGVYRQAIDHTGRLPGQTFAQRYWVDSEYATGAAAPVIYHICGEADVDRSYFLDDAALAWAKQLGARVVWLEHRYYGRSLPFNDLSTAHLSYLTLPNILEDLASFQKWLTTKNGWTGKWIAVGGSYSGTLSALYRQAHPELVAGALAASAPMISGIGQAAGSEYDVMYLSSTDPSHAPGERPWVYQACTGLGFWQADGPYINNEVMYPSPWLCQQLFGNTPQVDPVTYNQAYDLPFLSAAPGSPSNILFTYGSEDVWTNIGLYEQQSANPNISILLIEGAGHHFDLNAVRPTDNQAVIQARRQFVTLAQQWLQ